MSENKSYSWVDIVRVSLLIICLCAFISMTIVSIPTQAEINPQHEISDNTYTFTGQLGMVTYNHGWFGIGVTGTTLSFQNGTDIFVITSDKDLPVSIGLNYTVVYRVYSVTYFGVNNAKLLSSVFQNSTSVTLESIVLTSVGS